jgi:hypothetical protein
MKTISKPQMKIYKGKKNTITRIKYFPDLERFGMKEFSEVDV